MRRAISYKRLLIYDLSTLALFPARISEISSPRLNAWLKSRRDWKVETNGNHDKNAIGTKINTPIPASYILANSRTESHKPKLQTILFHAIAIDRIVHPVAINARKLAKRSGIDKSVKATVRQRAATSPKDAIPCMNRINSWKLVDLFGL